MKHSIKPYSKDISEVHEAFYKSTKYYLIPAWCITKRKIKSTRRFKIYAYHVTNKNIAPSKITDDRWKKEGMPSGASPSLVAWESLNIALGYLGRPQS